MGTVAESARQTLVMLAADRMTWVLGGANVLCALLAFVLGASASDRFDGRRLYCLLAWWLFGTLLMPWGTLYVAVQAVHGPLEDRTFQYLFLRPVRRSALLLGKWLGVTVAAAPTAAVAVALLFAAVACRPRLWPDGIDAGLVCTFVPVMAFGAVAYAAVGVLFGAAVRRPLIWSSAFVIGLQTLTANLDVSAGLRRLTIIDPLRRLLFDGIEPEPRLAQLLWPAEPDVRLEHVGSPYLDLTILIAVCLASAAFAWSRIEYDSRGSE